MTVYIVQELHWEWNDEAFVLERDTPIKAFESRRDAEAFRDIREAEARRTWGIWRGNRRDNDQYFGEKGRADRADAFYEVIAMELTP